MACVSLPPKPVPALPKILASCVPCLRKNGIPLAANPQPFVLQSAERMNALSTRSSYAMAAAVVVVALIGLGLSYRAVRPQFHARNRVEQVVLTALLLASTIAILTTIGIVLSMLSESLRFFSQVSPADFFFGTVWDPRFAAAGESGSPGQFGLIPLLAGTIYISAVAMAVAVPIGLYAAVYMSEYASSRLRAIAKPLLEVLAGIPTIVYGFFALVTVGPAAARSFRRSQRASHRQLPQFHRGAIRTDGRRGDGHHADPVCLLAFG